MRCPAAGRPHRAVQHGGVAEASEPGQQPGDRAQHRPLRRPHPGPAPVGDQPAVVRGGRRRVADAGVDRRLRGAGDPDDERRVRRLGQLDGARRAAARARSASIGEVGLAGAVPDVGGVRRRRRRRPRRAAVGRDRSARRVAGVGEGQQPRCAAAIRRCAGSSTAASTARAVPRARRRRGARRTARSSPQIVGHLGRQPASAVLGGAQGPRRCARRSPTTSPRHPRGVRGDDPHARRQRAAVVRVGVGRPARPRPGRRGAAGGTRSRSSAATSRPASSTSSWSSSHAEGGAQLRDARRRSRRAPAEPGSPSAAGRRARSTSTWWRACRSATTSARPSSASCSAPNARSVSSSTYRPARRAHHAASARRAGPARSADRRPVDAADRGGVGGGERPGEHRQVGERPLQVVVEQPERPRHGGAQRPVAGRRAVARRQQREAVVEAGGDLGDVVGVQPGRGQLDGQRQPVEAAHDLGDAAPARAASGSKPGATARARSTNSCDGRAVAVAGERQRRHGAHLLAGDPQPLAARRHAP